MGIWGEIKYAINSSLGTAKFEPLDVTLGKKSDTAGVTASHSLFSWVKNIWNTVNSTSTTANTINTTANTINTNTARGAVKSIQRGTAIMDYGNSTGSITIAISPVNVSKCQVLLNGVSFHTSGSYGSFVGFPYLSSFSASQLVVANSGYAANNTKQSFSWQVIEFY